MLDFFESEFGAGVMIGVGATTAAVGLTNNGPINWLFVATSAVSVFSGVVIYCMLKWPEIGGGDE